MVVEDRDHSAFVIGTFFWYKKNMRSKIFLCVLCCLLVLAYGWFMAVLLLTRQSDALLLTSIVASTFFLWAAWYTFLRKYTVLFLLSILLCLATFVILYVAVVDVTDPVLVGVMYHLA